MLVTCAYLVDFSARGCCSRSSSPRSARRATGAPSSVEAFAYRYVEGESAHARFREHRTVFPADFLGDFGFRVVRTSGRVGLARLELGGLVPVEEGRRAARAARGEGGVPSRADAGAAALGGPAQRRDW